MERIWAPWRMRYIVRTAEAEDNKDADGTTQEPCIFCRFPAESAANDAKNLIVRRGTTAFMILNAFPYSNGHLMVTPYRHTADLNDLNDTELLEMTTMTRQAVGLLKSAFKPDAFNIGMNLGRVAGAGIADHLHMHIVPRWNGDTNFMTVLGDVRVMPESLAAIHAHLHEILSRTD